MKKRRNILELLLFYIVSSFLLYIACISLASPATRPSSLPLALPKDLLANGFFVLKLIFWASVEELLYRVYFPNSLESFFSTSPDRTSFSFRCLCLWVFPHILFALAHSYLGFFNLLFAFFASIFLRKVYTYLQHKRGRVLGFIVICFLHSSYNICVLYLILE